MPGFATIAELNLNYNYRRRLRFWTTRNTGLHSDRYLQVHMVNFSLATVIRMLPPRNSLSDTMSLEAACILTPEVNSLWRDKDGENLQYYPGLIKSGQQLYNDVVSEIRSLIAIHKPHPPSSGELQHTGVQEWKASLL